MRAGNDAPVGRALADDLRDLLQVRQAVAADEGVVEIVEQIRCGRAGERDARAARFGVRGRPLAVPGRDEVERLGIGVLDPRALHERVEVVDVDEACAAVVRRSGDRPRQILLTELGGDEHDLPRLHVRTVNREVSEP